MAKDKMAQAAQDLEAALQESFIQRNWKKICIVCGVVVALIIVAMLGKTWMDARNEKAAEALYPCEHYFQNNNYDKALNGDGAECAGLLSVINQYGCTKAGNVARLYAAICYSNMTPANDEEAKKMLEDFDTKGDAMISPAAMFALGNLYVKLGDAEKGAKTFVKAAKKADNIALTPLCLQSAAEIYESQENFDKALDLYEEIKNNWLDSEQGREIEKYIEHAKALKK